MRGVLPALLGAAARGARAAIVPEDNAAEAATIEKIRSEAAGSLSDVVQHLQGTDALVRAEVPARDERAAERSTSADLAEVRGQDGARKLLEVAAAGGHNLLMMCSQTHHTVPA